MKLLIVIAFLSLVLGKTTFGAVKRSKCFDRHHENLPYTAESAFNDIFECISIKEDHEVECVQDRTHLDECIHNITEKLQPCIDSTSAYIPEFAKKALESVHEYLCEHDEKHFKELVSILRDEKCTNGIAVPFESCHPSKNILQGFANIHVTKDVFCKNARDTANCAVGFVRTYCSQVQLETFSGTADAFLVPCND